MSIGTIILFSLVQLLSFELLGEPSNWPVATSDGVPIFENVNQLGGKNGASAFFWVCGNPIRFSIYCDNLGNNDLEGPKAEMQIVFETGGLIHDYGQRHGIEKSECIQLKNEIKKETRKMPFCIRGELVSVKAKEIGWIFHEFRSLNGAKIFD